MMTKGALAVFTANEEMPRNGDQCYPFRQNSDFFYLTDLAGNELRLKRADGAVFACRFDPAVFRCVWIFASFGRLNGSRTLIMEPCTNYPGTLAEARRQQVCASLAPGEVLQTAVTWTVLS